MQRASTKLDSNMADVRLIKYDAACRAIAAARSVDEAKQIRDVAVAMRAYAKQAKNRTLEADSLEIKMRATRRIDQMRQAQATTVGLASGREGKRKSLGVAKTPSDRPTLAEAGIDKNLAKQARALGALSEKQFETAITRGREAIEHIVKLVTKGASKKAVRAQRETALAQKQRALPEKKYGVILADPEWRFEVWSRETGLTTTAADNHYPTSATDVIKERDVLSIAAPDCVLFLWATVPMLPQALEVMSAWGFAYKSHVAWVKDRAGTGYWFRNKHELLLVGTRGNIPAPAPGDQWDSVIAAPRREHSEKPEAALIMIERYFPNLPKIELNRRGPARFGWDAWGNEAETVEAAQ